MPTVVSYDCETGETTTYEMEGDELAAHEAHRAAAGQAEGRARFAHSEDAERLALVNERATTDPAFAALAELTLGSKGL